jgi:hypothetical protein
MPVLEQVVEVHLDGSAAGRRHGQDANTPPPGGELASLLRHAADTHCPARDALTR